MRPSRDDDPASEGTITVGVSPDTLHAAHSSQNRGNLQTNENRTPVSREDTTSNRYPASPINIGASIVRPPAPSPGGRPSTWHGDTDILAGPSRNPAQSTPPNRLQSHTQASKKYHQHTLDSLSPVFESFPSFDDQPEPFPPFEDQPLTPSNSLTVHANPTGTKASSSSGPNRVPTDVTNGTRDQVDGTDDAITTADAPPNDAHARSPPRPGRRVTWGDSTHPAHQVHNQASPGNQGGNASWCWRRLICQTEQNQSSGENQEGEDRGRCWRWLCKWIWEALQAIWRCLKWLCSCCGRVRSSGNAG